jgi:protein-S-isoprenylcysteine O-methyltransferase Ste14
VAVHPAAAVAFARHRGVQNGAVAVVALAVVALWMILVGAARTYLHLRATGRRPVRFVDRPGTPQWWSRAIGTIGFVLLVLAPIAELVGLPPFAILDQPLVRLAGLVVALAGVAGIVVSQAAMGTSWRGDVDPEARMTLVTSGPFRWIRNPIFTASALASLGVALMVPNAVALAMLVVNVTVYQVQVRLVEEPHLNQVHGEAYQAYARRTGRFVPWVGRGTRR